MRASTAYKAGYAPHALAEWEKRLRAWAAGEPPDLPHVEDAPPARAGGHGEVYAFFINGHKPLAPAAAMDFLRRIGAPA